MKANLLKKTILIGLKIMTKKEKRDLVLNLAILTMINQEEKRDLVLNLSDSNNDQSRGKKRFGFKSERF